MLARADAVVLSQEDVVGDESLIAQYAAQTRVLVVTEGAAGCTVYVEGRSRHFSAPGVDEVDPTGAGDVFAAVFFVHLQRNGDPWQALWAVLIMILVQQIDNHIITPVVQRTRVDLSPLVIVLALVIGGSLAGLLGVLVAVPVTAAIRILIGHLWRTRMLGQSWREASEAMIEVTEPPERFARISRKGPDQSRLFDTQEMAALDDSAEEVDVG